MKYFLLTLTVLIYYSYTLKAQYILAGDSGQSDHSFDFNPDTVVACVAWGGGCTIINFYVDINGDGVNDFKVQGKNSQGAKGSMKNYVAFIPEPHTQIAYGFTRPCQGVFYCEGDTSYFKLAQTFMENDTIDESALWSNEPFLHLNYEYVDLNCRNCRAGLKTESSQIYGVRVTNTNEVYYGWIKIRNIYNSTFSSAFTVEAYASRNKYTTGTGDDLQMQVFPNPGRDKISIHFDFPYEQCLLTLYNANGTLLLQTPATGSRNQIDIGSFPSGMYYLRLLADGKIVSRKILKL